MSHIPMLQTLTDEGARNDNFQPHAITDLKAGIAGCHYAGNLLHRGVG